VGLQKRRAVAADLGAAERLAPKASGFGRSSRFAPQQAAGKYLKALLVRSQVEFPKTHDIAKLLDRVAAMDAGAAERLRGADALTPFGVEARYPSDAPEVLPGGEIEAIGLARTVGNVVMASLQPYLDKPER
jgi:HEPN domain-containing protein